MQTVTLRIEDAAFEKMKWVLEHFKDEVEILSPNNDKNQRLRDVARKTREADAVENRAWESTVGDGLDVD